MVLSCRFYGNRYPEVEDVVMVNVRSIAEMGAYVHLLEYNNIEGMILLSELSRRRIRSINKLIRVGRSECVVVIRVDKDKGKFYDKSPWKHCLSCITLAFYKFYCCIENVLMDMTQSPERTQKGLLEVCRRNSNTSGRRQSI